MVELRSTEILNGVKAKAMKFAFINEPGTDEISVAPYLNDEFLSIQELINTSHSEHKAGELVQECNRLQIKKNELEESSKPQIRNLLLQKSEVVQQLESLPQMPSWKFKLIIIAVLAIVLIDSLLIYSTVKQLFPGNLSSIMISSAFAVVLLLGAHGTYRLWTRKQSSKNIKGLLTISICTVFFLLGVLRSYAIELSQMTIYDEVKPEIFSTSNISSGLIFMTLGCIVFLLAVYAAQLFENSKIYQVRRLKRKLKQIDSKISQLQKEIIALQDEINNLKVTVYERYNHAEYTEKQLLVLAKKIQVSFRDENLLKRNDMLRPHCLFNQVDFPFETYYKENSLDSEGGVYDNQ